MPPPPGDFRDWRLITLPRTGLFVAAVALIAGVQLERRNLATLGACLIIWMLVARITRPDLTRIRCRRDHGERVFEGETVRATLTLDPSGEVGEIQCLEICDEFSAGEGFYIRALLNSAFAEGKAARLFYRPRCERPRGLYVLGPLELRATDPSGLFETTALLDLFTNLLVYPRAAQLRRFEPLRTRAFRHRGERIDPLAGFSQEFREIREYRSGDNPRHIHWPVSARHGKLFVKVFEDTVAAETAIFLDLGPFARGLGSVTSEEACVGAAAAIVTRAIEESHFASLRVIGERESFVPLGSGAHHLYALLSELALARGGGSRDFASAIRHEALALRPGTTAIFVLVASAASPELEELLRSLRLRRVRVAAVLVEDMSFLALDMRQQVRRMSRRPLAEIAADWMAAGVEIFTLEKGADLARELEKEAPESVRGAR
jgi:uncharacterized protein (DUF58 family)